MVQKREMKLDLFKKNGSDKMLDKYRQPREDRQRRDEMDNYLK